MKADDLKKIVLALFQLTCLGFAYTVKTSIPAKARCSDTYPQIGGLLVFKGVRGA